MYYQDTDVTKIIRSLLGELYSMGYSKQEIALQLNINEKSIYKWEHGAIPKSNYFLNLQQLCNKAKSAAS